MIILIKFVYFLNLMGRKKLQLKHIQQKKIRSLTYKKRAKGFLRKAAQLSILCGIDVKIKICDQNGHPLEFLSSLQLKNNKEITGIHQLYTSAQYPDFQKFLMKGDERISKEKENEDQKDEQKMTYNQLQFENNAYFQNYYYGSVGLPYFPRFQ